ncbi:MAG: 2-dehydropantoate 2-reductase [Gammaproteobacteria bacterium]|nr:2-dehydropantoate 2-reductase [Gammaproteobacteria bacterium]
MKICVVGAGAIGGLLGARFARSGQDVTLIDRGPHLAAIQKDGLKLIAQDDSEAVVRNIEARDSLNGLGRQDLIVLAVKAHFLDAIARQIPALVDPETTIMTVQNGIPWWYFHRHGGPHDGRRLNTLDSTGVLEKKSDSSLIVGCVVYPAAIVPEPLVIKHIEGDYVPVGELDGGKSDRVGRLYDVLVDAGFRSRILSDIRSEIWLKAWGNLSFNPISALSHATLVAICQFPETRQLAADMMAEAQAVAEKLGITFRHTIEKRIAGAESVGAHKTSMLQDVEVGRSLETEALVGSILEMAEITGTPAPSIKAVYACVKLLNKVMLLEGAGVRVAKAG